MEKKTTVERLTLSVQEAAVAIGISTRTLHKFIKSGDIAVCRVGVRILIPVESLRQFIECRKQTQKS